MNFPKFHVQSLDIGSDKILCGTRNGDIYELKRTTGFTKSQENLIKKRMSCCDHTTPKIIAFSANKDRLFYVSDKGYFCVWYLKTLTLDFDIDFKKLIRNMVVCKKSPEVILVFEHSVSPFNGL